MEYVVLSLLAIHLILLLLLFFKKSNKQDDTQLQELIINQKNAQQQLKELGDSMRQELNQARKDQADSARNIREELGNQLNSFTKTFSDQLSQLIQSQSNKLDELRKSLEDRLSQFQEKSEAHAKQNREEFEVQMEKFKSGIREVLLDYRDRLKEQFAEMNQNQKMLSETQNEKLSEIKLTLQTSVNQMQESNEKKLDLMRKTVDEKLNDTLEKRLGESFKLVSERLEAVHKGLGDMQNLATNVGDLKKVMSNVKSRGIIGEYQLQNILEDLLTNEQYERNVKTKSNSGAVVEFAIKMPNGSNLEKVLWLPIDSKFPKEDYEHLVEAYDEGDIARIEEIRKSFIRGIKKNAQDIKEKYIDPPNTTEYGIMFLPFESLYAEVLRIPGLFEQIQKDYKITITGPTTLSALLNSLQMGFRTLAIEKRSSEVWDLLGAVKTEFGKFGDVLAKTKKKLQEATNVIEGSEVRSRAIERKLRKVQELPAPKAEQILDQQEDTEDL